MVVKWLSAVLQVVLQDRKATHTLIRPQTHYTTNRLHNISCTVVLGMIHHPNITYSTVTDRAIDPTHFTATDGRTDTHPHPPLLYWEGHFNNRRPDPFSKQCLIHTVVNQCDWNKIITLII